jgi:hypothetical protein
MTTKIFEDYLTQLDRKLGVESLKIMLFIGQCAGHLKNTIILSNIKVIFLPANCISQLQPLSLGIIHAFKRHYRKQLIWKTIAMLDGELLQRCYTDDAGCVVCKAFDSITLEIDNPYCNQELLCEMRFLD